MGSLSTNMPKFEFSNLSPHDFELLTRDLLQEEESIRLESFKSGRDGGIDFRYSKADNETIVQCKHFEGTGLSGLKSTLRKEVAKLRKLRPKRYILSTSVGLTPPNKDELIAILDKVPKRGDILGREDLENLLERHDKVLKSHFKIWLASGNILDAVLHNASISQSDFDARRVHRDLRRYVQNAAFPRALRALDRERIAIVSGVPGVGKTTLARMLLYTHLERKYEIISVMDEVEDARVRFNPEKRQIFYFDDFLGATFLGERAETLTRYEDKAIVDFMEMVRDSQFARMIMTTREHILSQAIQNSERFRHARISEDRCLIEMKDYSHSQKAKILYNHIYFSDLPIEYVTALLEKKFYKRIIESEKFNPRLIEWLSTFRRLKDVEPDDYRAFIEDLLENPAEIWMHAYENQISDAGRSVLLALYSLGGKSNHGELSKTFTSIHEARSKNHGFKKTPSDERNAIRELSEAFLNMRGDFEFIDPSVIDLLNRVILQDIENLTDIVEGSVRFATARRAMRNVVVNGSDSARSSLQSFTLRLKLALKRLLAAPDSVEEDGVYLQVDDTLEIRLVSLIEFSDFLKDVEFKDFVAQQVTSFTDGIEELSSLDEGIQLYESIRVSDYTLKGRSDGLLPRLLKALSHDARGYCSSANLRSLIQYSLNGELETEVAENLRVAAQAYRSNGFYDDLANCYSESDYDILEDEILYFQKVTSFNFAGPLNTIKSDRDEFMEEQSVYEDSMYDDWRERKISERNVDASVDDMFDSLRNTKKE